MPPPQEPLRRVSVLLVDDNADALDVISTYLVHYGAHVVTARSGLEALSRYAVMRPHVIVVDHSMPGMSGVELLGRIRKEDAGTPPVPAILCTAVAGMASVAREAGFDAYVVKPFDPHALVEEIARLAGVQDAP